MTNPFRSKALGCIYGGAIGDAMGYPVEFLNDMESFHRIYGPQGVQGLPSPALYSDDTQMTLRVAQGLSSAMAAVVADEGPSLTSRMIDAHVAHQLVLWEADDPPRAPGASCLHGVHAIARGVPYLEAGKPDSKGCGAVMRSAPYGIFFEDEREAAETAARQALMTHQHPAAQASAAALAVGVHYMLHTTEPLVTPMDVVAKMADYAEEYDGETAMKIVWAHALAKGQMVDPISVLTEWPGWTGDDAIASAVFCWTRFGSSYKNVVSHAVTSPGDSDSLGSIAGNLVGAHLGIEEINPEWVACIENTEHIKEVVDDLLFARQGS